MKVKIPMILHCIKWDHSEQLQYRLYETDLSKTSPNFIPVKTMEIECQVPDDFDPTPFQIEALKAKKKEILAEAHIQAKDIEEQIQRLLCIEHKPEVSA